jgi:molybdopterin synthase sulfur carrier subunit
MSVRVRFFAQFRELLGNDVILAVQPGTSFSMLVKDIAGKSREGYEAIFNAEGSFHEFVILMQNGKRIEVADAEKTMVGDGDEIAVFPPVAGG